MEDITREDSNITIIIILILFILLLWQLGFFSNSGLNFSIDYTTPIFNIREDNLINAVFNTQLTHFSGGLFTLYEHLRDKIN